MSVVKSVTVVVCTKDRPRLLQSCLQALARQTYGAVEVLVVDNASANPVAELCARWSAQYVRESRAGLCFARNVAARRAAGEIVAFLDDDAIPQETWLETLVAGFEGPGIAAVTGRILYMKSGRQNGEMGAEEARGAQPPRARAVFDRSLPGWFASACLGGVGDGSNMAIRRDALLASPGFDDRLGRGRLVDGGDEHLMFMSLLAMGHRIAHLPEAIVRHPYPGRPEDARAKLIHDRRTSIAYLMFLWGEFPAHRGDLVRYLAAAVARRFRPSGEAGVGQPALALNYADAFLAALDGFRLYLEARGEWASIAAPDYASLQAAQAMR